MFANKHHFRVIPTRYASTAKCQSSLFDTVRVRSEEMRLGRQTIRHGSQLFAAVALASGMTIAAAFGSTRADAQGVPPSIPAIFFGAVIVNGERPADGAEITAFIGDVDCTQTGNNGTFTTDGLSAYSITVAHASQIAGCGTDGATITFFIDGEEANQTATWKSGYQEVGLSIGGQAPPPLPTATPGGPAPNTPTDPTAAAATATQQARFTPIPAPSALPTDDPIFPTNAAGTAEAGNGTAASGTPGTTGTPGTPAAGTPTTTVEGGTAGDDDDGDGNGPLVVIAAGAAVLLIGGGAAGVMAMRRRNAAGTTGPPIE
jgi:hypothetical protein